MILGAEIAITVMGLMMLFRGRGIGKTAVAHPHYRWLGAACLTLFPMVFLLGIVAAVVYGISNPSATADEITKAMRWPVTGIEFAVVLLYAIGATLWDKRIRRCVEEQAAAS